MLALLISLGLGLATVSGAPSSTPRPFTIVGGNETTIERYPFQAGILLSYDLVNYYLICSGIIINNKSVLTSAHCASVFAFIQLRVRVGSTFTHSGGVVHKVKNYIISNRNTGPMDMVDLAIMRLASPISFNDQARPAVLAGPNYNLGDNEIVWASGWGAQWTEGPVSEHLRHVQIWTVNQTECHHRYRYYYIRVTDMLMCAGWLDAPPRHRRSFTLNDQGDPLVHNGTVVGLLSFDLGWGLMSYFPGIFIRISNASSWIHANA